MLNKSINDVFKNTEYEKYVTKFHNKGFRNVWDLQVIMNSGGLNGLVEEIVETPEDIYPICKILSKEKEIILGIRMVVLVVVVGLSIWIGLKLG